MGDWMMIEEIKTYLTDKKDGMLDYVNSKKDKIKTGAKKAVATGLVVSTLLGGATMMTGCDNDSPYEDESKDLKNIASQVDKFFKKLAKERDSKYEEDYSDLVIYKDNVKDKYLMIFAGEKCVWNATYEISQEEYDRLLSLAIASGNENVDANEKRIYIDRETLNDSTMNYFVSEVLGCMEGKEATKYTITDKWYQDELNGDFYWDTPNEEIFKKSKLTVSVTEQYYRDFMENDIEEIRFGHYNLYESEGAVYENGLWLIYNPDGSVTDLHYYGPEDSIDNYRFMFIDNIDTDGDGIDDTRKFLSAHTEFEFEEYFNELGDLLQLYEDDDNIRFENNEWVFNPAIIDDGKYIVFNEVFHRLMNAVECIATYKSESGNFFTEPIPKEQSMEK